MKKIIVAVALLAIVLSAQVVLADDSATTTEEVTTKTIIGETPLYILLAQQCKEVSYTEWESCIPYFNLQLRHIIKPINGCLPTTKQQVEQIRFCDSKEFFAK